MAATYTSTKNNELRHGYSFISGRLGQVSILGRHSASDAAHQIGDGGNLQQQQKKMRIGLQVFRQRCISRFSSFLSLSK